MIGKPFQLSSTQFVAETDDAIHDIERNLGIDKDVVWENVSEVEEGVLAMEEDQGSLHYLIAHFQPGPNLPAFTQTQDVKLSNAFGIFKKLLLKNWAPQWCFQGLAH